MNTPAQYANALSELAAGHPEKFPEYLENLKKVLASRGHEKLLPAIFAAYRTALLQQERSVRYRIVSAEQERTRTLLELYQRLITTE